MRIFNKLIALVLLNGLFLQGCKEPYLAEYVPEDLNPILIVEGYINVLGTESTYTLGYTKLMTDQSSQDGNVPAINATLVIEAEDGTTYTAKQEGLPGVYTAVHPILNTDIRYRLRIQAGGEIYLSDFVEAKISPEIDTVEWEENQTGVQLYVSTSDPQGDSRYYRWEFEETWKFHAAYQSVFVVQDNEIRYREREEQIYTCFLSDHSSDIQITTSEGLSEDVIYRYPFNLIPRLSEKLQSRYSILVKQRVMSKEAFVYWDLLKENSENLGDIFGPMPTEIRGNIVNVNNPNEPVIGMVEVSGIAEKRIYIDYMELSAPWIVRNEFYNDCSLSDTTASDIVAFLGDNPNMLPVYGESRSPANPDPTHYTYAPIRCVDCTVRGTLTVPAFWED